MIKAVCGLGHVTEYNLIIVPRNAFRSDWKCGVQGCTAEYLNNVSDGFLKPPVVDDE